MTRSVRQSLTIDEAMTFLSFSSKPLGEMFVYYDANNHVLFTLLSRASFLALGDAEWAIRLPAVVAGVAFLVLLARVLVRLLGESGTAVAAWVAVGSNPLLLDHLVAGRGYGMALALWMGALWVLLDGGEAGGWRRWAGAGVLLGLALAANLNLLFAGVGLGVAYGVWRGRDGGKAAMGMAASALLTAGPILYPALRHATRDNFYYGAERWAQTLDQFVWQTLMPVHGEWDLVAALIWANRVAPWVVGLTALGIAGLWRRREALFVALPMVLAFGLTEAAHLAAGLKYPLGRTALPLFVVTLLAMAALATVPRVRYGVVVVFVVLAACHGAAARWSYFGEWPIDGESRVLARVAAGQEGPMCATWTLLPALEYYRLRYRLPAPEMVPNERGPGCAWFFAAPADRQWPEENGFVEVAAGAQSKVKVYRNPGL